MIYCKQSTAVVVTVGPVLDADGVAVTDCVVGDFKIAKNGGEPAALNGSATLTHRSAGHYSLAATASDTDTIGHAEIVIDDSANACPPKELAIFHANVYDWMFGSAAPLTDKAGYSISGTITTLDALDTAQDSQHTATQLAISNLNDLSAAEVNAEVDTALADYDALVPADLPDNFAALGINASGHIERVTLVDTTTANTDMRGTDSAYTGTPPTAASIADAVWDEAQADHDGAGTFGAYLDASVSGVSTGGVSASDIADAVWDEALSGHVDAGSAGAELAATYSGTPPTAESISTQVASDLASAHGSGSWTTGDAAPTVDEIATRLLVSPANKLATNSDGSVNATVSGVDVDEEALADALIEAGVASQASVDAVKAKTDLLGTAGVTFHAPVASDATVSVRRSRDYHNSDGRALEWTNADGTWPDLTDATFKVLLAEPGKVTAKYVFSGTVVTPAGAGQKVRLELTDTQLAINADDYVYEGKATLASGNVIDLHGVSGPFSVLLGRDEPA